MYVVARYDGLTDRAAHNVGFHTRAEALAWMEREIQDAVEDGCSILHLDLHSSQTATISQAENPVYYVLSEINDPAQLRQLRPGSTGYRRPSLP